MRKDDLPVSHLNCVHLTSVEALRTAASAWDDLWQRSDVPLPTVRAELLAQWVEQFEPHAQLHALVVADQRRWVAALPLVPCRVGWVIPAGGLPTNPWSACGELLLDPAGDADAALDRLLAAAAELPWPLLWLNETMPEAPRWQSLLRACHRAGVAASYHERFRVGRVPIGQSWEAYEKSLPKNHRQAMRRAMRRLASEGQVQFEMQSQLPVEEVEPWLQAAFEVEDSGWKGEAGTSVLHTPGMFRFFVCHAQQLARCGQLETAAVRLDGRLLAFVYGFRAKGVYFAHKIGYDPGFAAFSPGQLLFHHILERLHSEGDVRMLDFLGPLNQSLSRWRPETYGVGRVVLAPHRWLGRSAIYAYQHWWRPLRDFQATAAARLHDRAKAPAIDDSSILDPAGTVG
jgi:CelD/BcsL family acetyltransferase involved in cellulose biosynthesis